MNGTTWLDRTNYFETVPSHQLELALWLEADRMGTLLDALSQENLDNQREVVKNEKRWSYDNRPYGSWCENMLGRPLPGRPSVPPHDDRLDGRPRRGVARGRQGVLPDALRPEQRGPLGRRRRRPGAGPELGRALLRRDPREPRPAGDDRRRLTLPPTLGREGRETVADRVPLPRIYWGFRSPVFGDPRLDALDLAGQILAGGKGSRLHRRLVREERLALDVALSSAGCVLRRVGDRRLGDRPAGRRPGASSRRPSGRSSSGWPPRPRPADELERAKALTEADELGALQRVEERADRLSMYATLFDDPDLVNRILPRYLAVTAEQIRDVCRDVFRPDNRLVMTYLPADQAAADAEAAA